MKKYIYSFLSFVILMGMASCTKDDAELGGIAPSSVTFTIQESAKTPNILELANTSESFMSSWTYEREVVENDSTYYKAFGSANGDSVEVAFAEAGNYRISLMAFFEGGQASKSEVVTIENTDASLLDTEEFRFLTGGPDNLEGKVWKFQRFEVGHNGLGPTSNFFPEWWAASKNQKPTLGHYDDELTFSMDGFKYTLNNNGDSHVLPAAKESFFSNYGGTVGIDGGEDGLRVDVDLNTEDWQWEMTSDGDDRYLNIVNGGFFSWYVGESKSFLILELTEEKLHLRTIGIDGNAWYYIFAPKDIADADEETDPVKELEAHDLFDNFSGQKSDKLNFETDAALVFEESYEFRLNENSPSWLVGKYERTNATGDQGWWQNYQAELPYRIDLSERNVFKMKVYFDASNDFTTPSSADETPAWLGEVAMTPTIALRLENSTDGEAWRSRAESLYTLGEDEIGTWIEVTFDFTTVMTDANKDGSYSVPATEVTFYDKVIIQIGGEGHTRPGTFYLSDFILQ
ncbi:hypothetical protein [Flammeovirga sp. EKP202]|uniref:hypothetical protein n=1 Tax=Flammeovirga sp. EKP202 TaxID=2770592 RepID=UPI00165FE098|nr:hypothetical protein [Flammeovirga sp. EKP202]MBD0401080.1 hypothetical protein [Flammeovirga sp. EKP202]